VANPANTNCVILSSFASKIPKKNFSCLTRLDHNRALAQLADKAKTDVSKVKNVIIWGNHSSTQYPDVTHGTINGKPVKEVIPDEKYLQGEFMTIVQKRGAGIIAARKASSALSAAKAIRDHMRSWFFGTAESEWVSMGVMTGGDSYKIDSSLCFSFPCKCKDFEYEVIPSLTWDDFSKEKIAATQKELLEEKKEALGA
jgi:malate dehydrogenase